MKLENILYKPGTITTDSRNIKKGDIFVAIKGKKYDGHDFAESAFRKGAALVIVSKKAKVSAKYKGRLVRVKNTLDALGYLAKKNRRRFNTPVIAITGSAGKTTAKEITFHILSAKFNVLKTRASENSFIGVPLTLTRLDKKHDLVVLEMGMNHLGEISKLCDIAKPSCGVITNIGLAHIGFLKTLNNVFKAKSELLKKLPKNSLAILNKDDTYLENVKKIKCRKIYFSINKKSKFQAKNISFRKNRWFFSIGNTKNFELSLLGKHNVYNALIAISVARAFGMNFSTIKKRLKSYKNNCPMRLEFKKIKGINILDDSYNSNPLSMEKALDTLVGYKTNGKRLVVSGDMLELGRRSREVHENIAEMIAERPIDALITLGDMTRFTNRRAKNLGLKCLYHASSPRRAAYLLKKIVKKGDVILFKGSRETNTESVIKELKGV